MPNEKFKDISNNRRIKGSGNRVGLPESQPDINLLNTRTIIAYVIANDLKIDMFYADDQGDTIVLRGYRSVSPVAIGSHVTSGNMVFRAFLMEGVSKSKRVPKWRLFRVDRVRSIRVYHSPSRAKWNVLYRPNDKHIGNMFQEAERDSRSVARAKQRRNQ